MKSILSILFLASAFVASGQIDKGSVLISGAISYMHDTFKRDHVEIDPNTGELIAARATDRANKLDVYPRAGYFLTSRFCAGIAVALTTDRSTTEAPPAITAERKSNSRGIGPFVRYYIPVKKDLYALAQGGFFWTSSKSSYMARYWGIAGNESNSEITSRQWSAGAGLTYFVSEGVGIELLAVYTALDTNPEEMEHLKVINVEFGFQVYLRR